MPVPTYIVQHTYLGEGPVQMHQRRPVLMLANRIEDSPREADCSGRALATLVIAWVGAALVASVLLKWTHMWVALSVLTLLFLIACGYAVCDARRTQERAFAREANRQLERRRRREQQLESVSGGVDNFPEIIDPPDNQTYWIADLPPSYITAVGTQTGNITPISTTQPEFQPPRLSNPPPYAIAVQSEPLFIPLVHNLGTQNNENNTTSVANGQNIILQSSVIEIGQTSSETGRIPSCIRDRDKVDEENDQNNLTTTTLSPIPTTRTQYLTSIINSTFGRNIRRTINNQEQNNNAGGNQTNSINTDRQNNIDTQNNNNDRNNNINHNNNVAEPPPAYPLTTRMSSE